MKKLGFDIDAYLHEAEEGFSYFDNGAADGWVEEEPKFNRKRILLLCR